MTLHVWHKWAGGIGLAVVAMLALAGLAGAQQGPEPKAPKWAYAFDLSCRKLGELEFTKDTKKFGVEAFKDANNNLGVYICQTGVIGLTAQFDGIKPPLKDSKAPTWAAGLDLKARKAGEQEFTDKTKTYSLEIFFDANANNWLYITENGQITTCPGKVSDASKLGEASKLEAPQWLHSFDLKCRRGGEKEWNKDTPQFGIEVYKDKNNGNLIYICETGSVAIIPAGDTYEDKKGPEWLHGQDLQCRKYGEKAFGKNTRKFGMEVFRDGHNGNLIFLTETGSIALAPGGKGLIAPTKAPKDAKFSHGLDLSCRQAGEKDFTPKTRTFAMEVYQEPNTHSILYLCETGAISAVPEKK
jgi:hypothetical protein